MLVLRILHHENIKDLARLVRIYRSNLKQADTHTCVVLRNERDLSKRIITPLLSCCFNCSEKVVSQRHKEREKERMELKRAKEKEFEERISAINAQQAQRKEELQRTIKQKVTLTSPHPPTHQLVTVPYMVHKAHMLKLNSYPLSMN